MIDENNLPEWFKKDEFLEFIGNNQELDENSFKFVNMLISEDEKTQSEKRINARRRKQAQRAREQEVRQIDPSQMAMVVRDQSGHLIIVDKNSYESDKHTPVVKPQDMSYSVALRIAQDPSFKNTVTSERILGEKVKNEQEKSEKDKKKQGSGAGTPVAGQQQQLGVPSGSPAPDTTPIDANVAKFAPVAALDAMKGNDIRNQIKSGNLTPDEANELMFSQNIQDFGSDIAQKLAKLFFEVIGRDINEYQSIIIPREPMQVTELWQQFASANNFPKTDVAFTHACLSSDSKEDKECKTGNCECEKYGLGEDEQIIKINIKYGKNILANGKMNGDIRALFEIMNMRIQELLAGAEGSVIGEEPLISESDRKVLETMKKSINEFMVYMGKTYGNIASPYGHISIYNKSAVKTKQMVEEYINKINETKMEVSNRLREIFSNNRIAMKLFFHEALTGTHKFEDTIAIATHLLAIDPQTQEIKLNKINEQLIDEMIDTNTLKLDINFKCDMCDSILEEEAWNNTLDEYERSAKEIPQILGDIRFCGREIESSSQMESFKKKILGKINEDTVPVDEESDPVDDFYLCYVRNYFILIEDMIKNAKKPDEKAFILFNLFNNIPVGIHTNPIDFYDAIENRDGIKTTTITIDGKQKSINIMNIPVFSSDDIKSVEDMSESYAFAKRFLAERKKRDYKREYRIFHGKPNRIKERAARVAARRKLMRQGRVHKGDGKDIDHKNGNPRDNSPSNLQVVSKSYNRAKK